MRMALMLCVIVGAGCVSTGRFSQLSPTEQYRFSRCSEPIHPIVCGTDTNEVYVSDCQRGAAAIYANEPDEHARKEWLMAHGCPPAMAER